MPLRSKAQARFLNWKFGHNWLEKHHFGGSWKNLPSRAGKAIAKRLDNPEEVMRLDRMLDDILSFQYQYPYPADEGDWTKTAKTAGTLAAGAGLGYGGLKGYQYLKGAGEGSVAAGAGKVAGQIGAKIGTPAANIAAGKQAFKLGRDYLGEVTGNVPKLGSAIGGGLGKVLRAARIVASDPSALTEFQYNPTGTSGAAGQNPAAILAKKKAGIGSGSNIQRAMTGTPRSPGVPGGAAGTLITKPGSTSAIAALQRYFKPEVAARVAAYSSKEQPQIFESAEDTIDFKEGGKWIQKAIKHPGALKKSLHVKAGHKIPAKKLHAAAEKGGKLGRRARLAETLKKLEDLTEPIELAIDRSALIKQGSINPHISEHILDPWQGVMSKSKIIQEDFPSGISPAMALRFPLPKIMRFLKARRPQLLQQDFPGFSSRMNRLIQLEKRLDSLQFAEEDYYEDASRHKTAKQAAGISAVGAGVYAGLKGHRAVIRKYGRRETLPMHAATPTPGFEHSLYWGKIAQPSALGPTRIGAGAAYKAAGKDIYEQATQHVRRGLRAGKFVYGRHAEGAGLGGRIAAVGHGVRAGLRHLNSRLDDVIEFGIKKN